MDLSYASARKFEQLGDFLNKHKDGPRMDSDQMPDQVPSSLSPVGNHHDLPEPHLVYFLLSFVVVAGMWGAYYALVAL